MTGASLPPPLTTEGAKNHGGPRRKAMLRFTRSTLLAGRGQWDCQAAATRKPPCPSVVLRAVRGFNRPVNHHGGRLVRPPIGPIHPPRLHHVYSLMVATSPFDLSFGPPCALPPPRRGCNPGR